MWIIQLSFIIAGFNPLFAEVICPEGYTKETLTPTNDFFTVEITGLSRFTENATDAIRGSDKSVMLTPDSCFVFTPRRPGDIYEACGHSQFSSICLVQWQIGGLVWEEYRADKDAVQYQQGCGKYDIYGPQKNVTQFRVCLPEPTGTCNQMARLGNEYTIMCIPPYSPENPINLPNEIPEGDSPENAAVSVYSGKSSMMLLMAAVMFMK